MYALTMPIAMYVCTHNAYIAMYVFTQTTTDYDQVFHTHTYTHTLTSCKLFLRELSTCHCYTKCMDYCDLTKINKLL